MKPIFKRLLSGVLSVAMTVSAIPIASAHADVKWLTKKFLEDYCLIFAYRNV